MNSIPLLITAAFCLPAGIVIGFCIAGIFRNRAVTRATRQAWLQAQIFYSNKLRETQLFPEN
jgi:hypothetical protein